MNSTRDITKDGDLYNNDWEREEFVLEIIKARLSDVDVSIKEVEPSDVAETADALCKAFNMAVEVIKKYKA